MWSALVAVGLGVVAWARWVETEWLQRPEVGLEVERWPAGWSGLRIAHVSDVHGRACSLWGYSLAQLVSELAPDLVAVTGDLVGSRQDPGPALEVVGAMARRHPVFYVPGNHERARRDHGEPLLRALARVGATVLVNSCTRFSWRGVEAVVAGVDDPVFGRDRPGPAGARAATLLLAHSPEAVLRPAAQGAALVLCGHTHGGQIRVPGLPPPVTGTRAPRVLAAGVHRYGGTTVATSRGVGTSLLPLRLGCRPELPVYTVTSRDPAAADRRGVGGRGGP